MTPIFLHNLVSELRRRIQLSSLKYWTVHPNVTDGVDVLEKHEVREPFVNCPSCGVPIESGRTEQLAWTHNIHTCRLVNIALSEIGVGLHQPILVDVGPFLGPLKGFYTPSDPYTIHISEDAYLQFPEYMIFHETKHLVDCLVRGWSEEDSPDYFSRSLCAKYGFSCPSPHHRRYHAGFPEAQIAV